MNFDDVLYNQLLGWAKTLLRTRKIDNLTEVDLINQAYVELLEKSNDISVKQIKDRAYEIFRDETGMAYANDINWLEIGEGNPNYKTIDNTPAYNTCKKCLELKHMDEFRSEIIRGRIKMRSICKKCANKMSHEKKYGISDNMEDHRVVKINVFDEEGNYIYKGISISDVSYRLNISKQKVNQIIKTGKRYKNVLNYAKEML